MEGKEGREEPGLAEQAERHQGQVETQSMAAEEARREGMLLGILHLTGGVPCMAEEAVEEAAEEIQAFQVYREGQAELTTGTLRAEED